MMPNSSESFISSGASSTSGADISSSADSLSLPGIGWRKSSRSEGGVSADSLSLPGIGFQRPARPEGSRPASVHGRLASIPESLASTSGGSVGSQSGDIELQTTSVTRESESNLSSVSVSSGGTQRSAVEERTSPRPEGSRPVSVQGQLASIPESLASIPEDSSILNDLESQTVPARRPNEEVPSARTPRYSMDIEANISQDCFDCCCENIKIGLPIMCFVGYVASIFVGAYAVCPKLYPEGCGGFVDPALDSLPPELNDTFPADYDGVFELVMPENGTYPPGFICHMTLSRGCALSAHTVGWSAIVFAGIFSLGVYGCLDFLEGQLRRFNS